MVENTYMLDMIDIRAGTRLLSEDFVMEYNYFHGRKTSTEVQVVYGVHFSERIKTLTC